MARDLSAVSPFPIVRKTNRLLAQTGAIGTLLSYTVGAADGSFELSAEVLATVSTSHQFGVTVAWTDENGVSRSQDFAWRSPTGFPTLVVNGGGPFWNGLPIHIRAKAATTITISTTSGGGAAFTDVTYNVGAIVRQLA